jgi:predicted PurR-regulated permease PerM
VAGLFEVVPIVGPVASVVPALLFTAPQSSFLGLSVLALYFIVQQVENQILVPIVINKTVGLNPIVTLVVLILGGRFAGSKSFLSEPILTMRIVLILPQNHPLPRPNPE